MFVGMTATVPAGLFIQRFGVRVGAAFAATISFFSYGLIAGACMNADFFADRYWVLIILFLMAGIV